MAVALGVGYGMGANIKILNFAPEAVRLIFGGSGIVRRCVRGWGDTVFDDCLYSLMREEFK